MYNLFYKCIIVWWEYIVSNPYGISEHTLSPCWWRGWNVPVNLSRSGSFSFILLLSDAYGYDDVMMMNDDYEDDDDDCKSLHRSIYDLTPT